MAKIIGNTTTTPMAIPNNVMTIENLGEITTQEQVDNLTSLSTGWVQFNSNSQIYVDLYTQYKWILAEPDDFLETYMVYTINNGTNIVQMLFNTNYLYPEFCWREGWPGTIQNAGSVFLKDLFTIDMLPINTHQTMSDDYLTGTLEVPYTISGMQGQLPASYDAVKQYINDKISNLSGGGTSINLKSEISNDVLTLTQEEA